MMTNERRSSFFVLRSSCFVDEPRATNNEQRTTNHGYSLVEVLIAIAVTGFVLLTVVTLFYMGRRNVYSGKQMSYSVSVGTRMLEDLAAMTGDEMMADFGINDQTPLTSFNQDFPQPNTQYLDSYMIDTDNITASNDPKGYLTAWKGLIGAANLTSADAGLIFTPRAPVNAGSPWLTAQFIKVRAFVAWNESNRRRYAYFDTTKTNRTGP
jgi:prepilin-type N-terminal cleavage/methylation domain-containing protein